MNKSAAFDIRPKSWTCHAFPQVIYLDANVVIDLIKNRPLGPLVRQYIAELVERGGMVTWSQHTINEVHDILHVSKYVDYADKNSAMLPQKGEKPKWKIAEDTVTDNESIRLAREVFAEESKILQELHKWGVSLDNEINSAEAEKLAREVHQSFGGSRKDAYHVACANLCEVNDFLTHDPGILRYPGVNVYGASQPLNDFISLQLPPANYIDLASLLKLKC